MPYRQGRFGVGRGGRSAALTLGAGEAFPGTPPAPAPAAYCAMDVDGETDSNRDTALTLACAGGHEDLVELLLSRGADIEHRDKKVRAFNHSIRDVDDVSRNIEISFYPLE